MSIRTPLDRMGRLWVPIVLVLAMLAGCAAPAPGSATDVGPSAPPGSPPGSLSAEGGPSARSLQTIATADAPGGYALRVHEERAYVATFTAEEGIAIFDVSDPASPAHLGGIVGTLARSVDVLDWGERVGVALSTGTELEVWDVTDPAEPERLASFAFGSHNVQVHPTANVVYNARNVWDGVGGAMEIVDASDPEDIALSSVWTFPAFAEDGSVVRNQGCHDLTIFPETQRAYCAAYEQTLIMDVSDPLRPVILTAIGANPLLTSHHTAFPILDHSILVIGDEWLDNFVWGCVGGGLPAGALWFYDLSVSPPQPISYLQAPELTLPDDPSLLLPLQGAMCTSHNGMEVGAGTGIIAYGWFHAGLALIDASDPAAPFVLDMKDIGGAVGDVRAYDGHLFAADDEVGLTVLRVD